MTMFKVTGTVIATFILLSGCTTHIYKGGKIDDDVGLVLLSTYCAHPVGAFRAFPTGKSVNFWSAEFPAVAVLCERNEETILVELPAGSYFIGAADYYAGQNVYGQHGTGKLTIEEKDALKFEVKPNSVNYIGMIVSSSRQIKNDDSERTDAFNFRIYSRDREERDRQSIKESYPGLLEEYSYFKGIAEK
jgi:hypothetical protein